MRKRVYEGETMQEETDKTEQELKKIAFSEILAEMIRPNVLHQVYIDDGKSAEEVDPGPYFDGLTFKEKEGDHYVILVKEVKKEPDERSDVIVYKIDPVDRWKELIFSRSFSGTKVPKSDAAKLFREFRDCEDIEDMLNSQMIVGYESKREAIKANENSLIQCGGYDSLEKALNRRLVKPGDPVLVYYESDEFTLETRTRCVSRFGRIEEQEVEEEVRDNYALLFRMPEERFCIRGIVSGETSGDYIDVHDLWIQRPALKGFRLDESSEKPSRFSKGKDERLYIETGVMNFGSFLVALGQDAINQVMMDPDIKEKYGVGFRPVRYNISQALGMMPGESENNHGG
jgi:hypothetical protein